MSGRRTKARRRRERKQRRHHAAVLDMMSKLKLANIITPPRLSTVDIIESITRKETYVLT
jgi:hypothetical protein